MTSYVGPEMFEDLTPSASQRLGGALGQGISSGLQMLLQNKIQSMNQQKENEALESLGIPRGTPKELQREFIKHSLQSKRQDEMFNLIKNLTAKKEAKNPNESLNEEISDDQILAFASQNAPMARILQDQKKMSVKQNEVIAKRDYERVKPYLLRSDEIAESLPRKESALHLMEDAIKNENLSFFSKDKLADFTGIEAFRTAKGAQFIASAKEFFLGNIKRAGARPNQWIEQQISKMLPLIGRDEAANLTVLEAFKSEMKLDEKQIELTNKLSEEDVNEYGYIKGNLPQRVRKEMKTFASEEQDRLEKELRSIDELSKLPKAKGNKKLTPTILEKYYSASNNDPEKTKELLRKNGFEFTD